MTHYDSVALRDEHRHKRQVMVVPAVTILPGLLLTALLLAVAEASPLSPDVTFGTWDERLDLVGVADHEDVRHLSMDQDCAGSAFDALGTSCKRMNTTVKQKLAVSVTNCHLRSAGRPYRDCPVTASVVNCTVSMSDTEFVVYTEFMTHIDSICFFLQGERFSREIERLIALLAETSSQVGRRLADANVDLGILMDGQASLQESVETTCGDVQRMGQELSGGFRDALKAHSELDAAQRDLRKAFEAHLADLDSSVQAAFAGHELQTETLLQNQQEALQMGQDMLQDLAAARASFVDLSESIAEERETVRVNHQALHDSFAMLTGAANAVATWWFFICFVNMSWVLTTSPRTRGARWFLFSIFTVNMVIELVIKNALQYLAALGLLSLDGASASTSVLCFRKAFCVLALLRLAFELVFGGASTPSPAERQERAPPLAITQDAGIAARPAAGVEEPPVNLMELNRDELDGLDRRSLQRFAKETGVCKGNISSELIREALLNYVAGAATE